MATYQQQFLLFLSQGQEEEELVQMMLVQLHQAALLTFEPEDNTKQKNITCNDVNITHVLRKEKDNLSGN